MAVVAGDDLLLVLRRIVVAMGGTNTVSLADDTLLQALQRIEAALPAGGGITVGELDGTPTYTGIRQLTFPNGTLTQTVTEDVIYNPWVTPPTFHNDPGVPGQRAYDPLGRYLYVCFDVDNWARLDATTGW